MRELFRIIVYLYRQLYSVAGDLGADEVEVEVVEVDRDLDHAGNELDQDEVVLVEVHVYPAHDVEDLVDAQAGHVGASYDLDLPLLVNDVQLRDDREGLKPDRETPEVVVEVLGLDDADVEEDRKDCHDGVDYQVVIEAVDLGIVADTIGALEPDEVDHVGRREDEQELEDRVIEIDVAEQEVHVPCDKDHEIYLL